MKRDQAYLCHIPRMTLQDASTLIKTGGDPLAAHIQRNVVSSPRF